MAQYPIMLDVSGRICVVVGGGKVALRKIEGLLRADARVRVIAQQILPEIKDYMQAGLLEWLKKSYEAEDLRDATLVISATDTESINQQVARDARSLGIFVNVVDQPSLCTFTVPAVLQRGELIIGIATGGKSPALAGKIRERLEEQFGPEYASYVEFLGRTRQWVRDQFPHDPDMRQRANTRIAELPLVDYFARGQESLAEEKVKRCILSLSA